MKECKGKLDYTRSSYQNAYSSMADPETTHLILVEATKFSRLYPSIALLKSAKYVKCTLFFGKVLRCSLLEVRFCPSVGQIWILFIAKQEINVLRVG